MNSIICTDVMQKVCGSAVAKTEPQDVVCGEMSQMKEVWGAMPDGERFVDYPIGGSNIGLAESFRQSPSTRDQPLPGTVVGRYPDVVDQWKSIFGEAKKVLKQLGVDGAAEENEPVMRIHRIDHSETASDAREPVHVVFNTAPVSKAAFPPHVLGRNWTIAALLPPDGE